MTTTLGQVQIRLSKLAHGAGVDKTVLLGLVNDVYQRFLGSYQWSRLVKTGVIETTALYQTGTVAITAGTCRPACAITANSPAVLSATVLPPVFGPVTRST